MSSTDIDLIIAKAEAEAAPTPGRREVVAAAVRQARSLLTKEAAHAKVRPRIVIGGSYAHDTWLGNRTDVNFFLIYPKEVVRGKFEEMGLSVSESALKDCSPKKRYAEHPYIEAEVGGVTINAVPCYGVAKGEWKSAADRSPYHTLYMEKHLDEALRSQVRVLKLFMRNGPLRRRDKVRGFSGYACEVLTLKYGSFLGVIRAASSWGRGTIVSVEGGEERAKALFADSTFILLDPVNTTRNLGLAVSPTKLAEFMYVSRLFGRKPSLGFFHGRRLSLLRSAPAYAKENTILLAFRFEDKSEDILWGELWKSAAGISNHLSKDGAQVLRLSVAAEDGWAAIAFIVSPNRLPRARTRSGPEVFMGDATDRFLKSSGREADSWWMGDDLRSHTLFEGDVASAEELLRRYMKDPVASVGFARGLSEMAKKRHAVLSGGEAYASRRSAERQALAELVGYGF